MNPDKAPKFSDVLSMPVFGNEQATKDFKKALSEKMTSLTPADREKIMRLMSEGDFGKTSVFVEAQNEKLQQIIDIVIPDAVIAPDASPVVDITDKDLKAPSGGQKKPTVSTGRGKKGTAQTTEEKKEENAEDESSKADSSSPSGSPFDSGKRTEYKDRSDSFKEKFEERSVDDLIAQIDRLQALINARREGADLSHFDAGATAKLDGYVPLKLQLGKLKNELGRYKDKTLNREDYEHIHQMRGTIAQYGMQFRDALSEYKKHEKPDPDPDDPKPKPGPEPGPDDPKPGSEKGPYEKAREIWLDAKQKLKTSEVEHFDDNNKRELKELNQKIEDLGKVDIKNIEYVRLMQEKKVLLLREEAYKDAKQRYISALHSVLEERKELGVSGHDAFKPRIKQFRSQKDGTALDETSDEIKANSGFDAYRATIGAHFFAKQGDTGFRENKDGRDLRSYHDKEHAFNQEILPEEKKVLFTKMRDGWNKISPLKKALLAGSMAGVAFALNPTRMVTAFIAGTLVRGSLNIGWISDERFKERFAKKVVEQKGKYDTTRIDATSMISPESFRELEESLNSEFSAIKDIEKSNKNKLAGISATKTVLAAAAGVAAGSWAEGNVFGGPESNPAPREITPLPMDTGTPLTEVEMPPIASGVEVDVVPETPSVDVAEEVVVPVEVKPETIEKTVLYDVEAGDNYWDIMEGQTSATQPEVIQQVEPECRQALIDLVRDEINAMTEEERSALGFGGSASELAIGADVNLTALNEMGIEIAQEKGWLPEPVLETIVVEPEVTLQADTSIESTVPTETVETVQVTPEIGVVDSSREMLQTLGFTESQIDTITTETEGRYADGMTATEKVILLENITQRDILTARLDGVAGVSPEKGLSALYTVNPAEIQTSLTQGTLESVLSARGVDNPAFYASVITELHTAGLFDNASSVGVALENAIAAGKLEVVTTMLGEEKLRIGSRGLFGTAKTINL